MFRVGGENRSIILASSAILHGGHLESSQCILNRIWKPGHTYHAVVATAHIKREMDLDFIGKVDAHAVARQFKLRLSIDIPIDHDGIW
jgi:hypothetical protein